MPTTQLPAVSRKLLIAVTVTNAVAAFAIVATMSVTEGMRDPARTVLFVALLVLIGLVWAMVLQRQFASLVEAPLADSVHAAELIAAGDTSRRLPPARTQEFQALATSVNRMTEQLLEADQQRLRVEKLATLGRLAAGIAHEVGNPLAAVSTYAHIVRMRTDDVANVSANIAEPLDAIEREVARIDRIVRGLLDYARPRLLTPKPCAVDAVLGDVLRLLTDQGVMRRVLIEQELAAEGGLVYAERHDLEQLFVNLVLNAVDAMDGEGKLALRTRVTSVNAAVAAAQRRTDAPSERFPHQPNGRAAAWVARADRPEAVLQVVIADSGPGVAAEDEERIFEPFFSTKQTGKGTGLGLAIVARIAENLGGTVWVQRAREGGAAFVLLFPLHTNTDSFLRKKRAENTAQMNEQNAQ
ncbi:MAG: HAMP domain-containing protein [Phycisphaerae bacterium]|nr:HAMP domain-containing protein [Gemmatimonadaceae bacterium]